MLIRHQMNTGTSLKRLLSESKVSMVFCFITRCLTWLPLSFCRCQHYTCLYFSEKSLVKWLPEPPHMLQSNHVVSSKARVNVWVFPDQRWDRMWSSYWNTSFPLSNKISGSHLTQRQMFLQRFSQGQNALLQIWGSGCSYHCSPGSHAGSHHDLQETEASQVRWRFEASAAS